VVDHIGLRQCWDLTFGTITAGQKKKPHTGCRSHRSTILWESRTSDAARSEMLYLPETATFAGRANVSRLVETEIRDVDVFLRVWCATVP
jgi:hypothetical protein